MGCASFISKYAFKRKNQCTIRDIIVYVPSVRVPIEVDLKSPLDASLSPELVEKLSSLRAEVVSVAERWNLINSRLSEDQRTDDGSIEPEIQRALQSYLPVLAGLVKKEYNLQNLAEFKWKCVKSSSELSFASSWYELLSVLHMLSMIYLSAADTMLLSSDTIDTCESKVSEGYKKDAFELLLKASGFLEYAISHVLVNLPHGAKKKIHRDLQEPMLEAIFCQTLGQAVEMQLGLAIESENATLSVKRRLACEQMTYFSQAYARLSGLNDSEKCGKKHLSFVKWKYLEAKCAAYYFHGLMLDKDKEKIDHISALHCLLAADELLTESKKSCLAFCLAKPVTRVPPAWGAMKYVQRKIPETILKKAQMYNYLLDVNTTTQQLSDLPEFQLSLKPEEFELPTIDPLWERQNFQVPVHKLKDHLQDSDEDMDVS